MNNGPMKGTAGEVIANLRALPTLQAQYQVHKNMRADGVTNNTPDQFIANLGGKDDGNFIHCRVTADGKSYTVEIPATGHTHTYTTKAK